MNCVVANYAKLKYERNVKRVLLINCTFGPNLRIPACFENCNNFYCVIINQVIDNKREPF
jgi:hypothetical protein